MSTSSWVVLITVTVMAVLGSQAQVIRLAKMFEDGMILQMEPKRSQISGIGQPGARVTVKMDGGAVTADSIVTGDSEWNVLIPPQPPGGPHNFTIDHSTKDNTRQTLSLNNVLFGEIWVCAGEGNMEFEMRNIFNATDEMEKALQYSRIHLMQVEKYASEIELGEPVGLSLSWSSITSENVGDFPAVCLLYGERISEILGDIHIGLIAVTWEDTPIESWVSERVTSFCETPPSNQTGKFDNNAVWNGMVHPLTRLAVRGVIFAQGESNIVYNLDLYKCHFLNLTQDWQEYFVDGTVNVTPEGWAFPIGFVQLGAIDIDDHESAFKLRDHQTLDTDVAPSENANETFMASAYDLFDPLSPFGSIYFRDKQTVATRLSHAALRLVYNQTDLHFIGPIPVMIWDFETSIMNTSYTWDVKIQNGPGESSGFSYRVRDGEWYDAPMIGIYEGTFTFYVDPNYTHIAYGWNAIPCEYKKCNVYSDRPDGMPHITMDFQSWT